MANPANHVPLACLADRRLHPVHARFARQNPTVRVDGAFGYEGAGPTDPDGFTTASYYPQGAALVGNADDPLKLSDQGVGLLLVSLMLLGVFMLVALRPTTAYSVRFGLFVPGVLLLVLGGILNPGVAIYNEVQHPEEITVEQLIDMRLQQLGRVC